MNLIHQDIKTPNCTLTRQKANPFLVAQLISLITQARPAKENSGKPAQEKRYEKSITDPHGSHPIHSSAFWTLLSPSIPS